MKLAHGSHKSAVLGRISTRALAITNTGATREELRDSTDVNSNEEREIEMAESLAAAWARGETIEAWHLVGVWDLYTADIDPATIPDSVILSERARRNSAKRVNPGRNGGWPVCVCGSCPACKKRARSGERLLISAGGGEPKTK